MRDRTDSRADPDLVLGIDVGGSSTRALVASISGHPRHAVHGAGANPVTHPPETAVARLGAVLDDVLADTDPRRVRAAVFGLAGGVALDNPGVEAQFRRIWRQAGLRCQPRIVSDLETAFAGGSPAGSGTAVVAGTGAVAAAIRGHTLVRAADGHGWLLGDDGSGFWLGRQAVRAALAALDGRGPQTLLTRLVIDHLLTPEDSSMDAYGHTRALVQAANDRPPIELARMAPLITRAADAGDAVAVECVNQAARHLASSVNAVRAADESGPIVLAGSVLHPDTPVGRALTRALVEKYGSEVLCSFDSAAGASWLAARDAVGEGPDARRLHRTMVDATAVRPEALASPTGHPKRKERS